MADQDDPRFVVSASAVVAELRKAGVNCITTVPDLVQIALHHKILNECPDIRVITCCTEEQATTTAAGLIIGGSRPAIIVQNQGLYACINALRGAGLDAGLPLVYLVGQFGREPENLGSPTTKSARRLVRILSPLLDTLDVPHLDVEGPEHVSGISEMFATARRQMRPAAIVFGNYIAAA